MTGGLEAIQIGCTCRWFLIVDGPRSNQQAPKMLTMGGGIATLRSAGVGMQRRGFLRCKSTALEQRLQTDILPRTALLWMRGTEQCKPGLWRG